jgi:hypothetical protein
LHEYASKPTDATAEGIMHQLEALQTKACDHQARLLMCSQLVQTRARHNSVLQQRLEQRGGVLSARCVEASTPTNIIHVSIFIASEPGLP